MGIWVNGEEQGGGAGGAILGTGTVAQVVHAMTATKVSGTTILPQDDTIPQNTEGMELLTCAITPKVSTSNLLITISGWFRTDHIGTISHAIFKDSDASAIAWNNGTTFPASGYISAQSTTFVIAAGSTSARTYKWRFGSNNAGTAANFGGGSIDDNAGLMQHTISIAEVLA